MTEWQSQIDHFLLFGVTLNLDLTAVEYDDKKMWVISKNTGLANTLMTEFKDSHYNHHLINGKRVALDYIFPNGELVRNVEKSGRLDEYGKWEKGESILTFLRDDSLYYKEREQFFGLMLMADGNRKRKRLTKDVKRFDEKRILDSLNRREEVAEKINAYGFNFKPEELFLHCSVRY